VIPVEVHTRLAADLMAPDIPLDELKGPRPALLCEVRGSAGDHR